MWAIFKLQAEPVLRFTLLTRWYDAQSTQICNPLTTGYTSKKWVNPLCDGKQFAPRTEGRHWLKSCLRLWKMPPVAYPLQSVYPSNLIILKTILMLPGLVANYRIHVSRADAEWAASYVENVLQQVKWEWAAGPGWYDIYVMDRIQDVQTRECSAKLIFYGVFCPKLSCRNWTE